MIQLIIGNIQTENKPLEIGLNALNVVQKDSKKGLSAAAYSDKIGLSSTSLKKYLYSAQVFSFIKKQSSAGGRLLTETEKLVEISKLPKNDWLWLHNFIIENECSKNQVISIVKALRTLNEPLIFNFF